MSALSLNKKIISILGFFILTFISRSFFILPPESGGDAIAKWDISSLVAEGEIQHLGRNHHASRWAINIPATVIITFLGDQISAYYILPLIFFSLSTLLFYFITRNSLSPLALFCCLIFYYFEPMSFRGSSQLQAFVFVLTYFLLASISIKRFIQDPTKKFYLFLSALFLFFCYGSGENYAFFIPAFLLLIFKYTGIKNSIIFTSTIMIFFVVEIIFFNLISDRILPFGRLSITTLGYGSYVISTFRKMLTGYFNQLNFLNSFLLFASLILSLILIKRHGFPKQSFYFQCFFLSIISYLFFAIFAFRSFSPYRPFLYPEEKYLTSLFPLLIYLFFYCLERLTPAKFIPISLSVSLIFMIYYVGTIINGTPVARYSHNGLTYPKISDSFWRFEHKTNIFLSNKLSNGDGIIVNRFYLKLLEFISSPNKPKKAIQIQSAEYILFYDQNGFDPCKNRFKCSKINYANYAEVTHKKCIQHAVVFNFCKKKKNPLKVLSLN